MITSSSKLFCLFMMKNDLSQTNKTLKTENKIIITSFEASN